MEMSDEHSLEMHGNAHMLIHKHILTCTDTVDWIYNHFLSFNESFNINQQKVFSFKSGVVKLVIVWYYKVQCSAAVKVSQR